MILLKCGHRFRRTVKLAFFLVLGTVWYDVHTDTPIVIMQEAPVWYD
jgi:hypothetical protein